MKPRPILNPPNRFLAQEVSYDLEGPGTGVQVLDDSSREIISHNDSPDLPFSHSVNPYRGCVHACAYCYARPTHEYLGFGAGTDFDTRIVVKRNAPELLRAAFEKPSWKGELLMFSGVTDCYQPLESSLKLTRGLLEVCIEYRNPVAVITKSALVERDVDLFQTLTREASCRVMISIPIWDEEKARAIEPWVPSPARRVAAIAALAKAGVRVGVMIGPVIPGLGDEDIPRILAAAREAGATRASWVLLRLSGSVLPVFEERLRKTLPELAERVLNRVRGTRGGALNEATFGVRGRGRGPYAETIQRLFDQTAQRLGFERESDLAPPGTTFRRPPRHGQMLLF